MATPETAGVVEWPVTPGRNPANRIFA
jgi:hypothetical protein